MWPRRKRFNMGLIVALAIGAMLCAAFIFNLFSGVQLRSSDFLFIAEQPTQEKESGDTVVVIAIDDHSLARLGNFWLWPRSYYTDLIDILTKAKARVVVFDVLFSEPAPGDEELAASIKDAGNVVLPIVELATLNSSTVTDEPGKSLNFLRPLPILEENASVGHANVLPDRDGAVRRLPIVVRNGEVNEPALALAAVAKYLRRPAVIEPPIVENRLNFAGRLIPINDNNEMLINYTGNCAEGGAIPFQTISFADVLGGKITSNVFEDKIVIIGATASGLGDAFWTPTGHIVNGVQIHANAINTILAANFLRPSAPSITVASILVLALICGLIVLRLRIRWAILSALSICIAYFLLASAFFDRGIMLNMLYPPLTIAGAFVGVSLYNAASERAQRDELAKTFGRYVSPSVVKRISMALEQGELKLGGKEQEITVAFADVRGFTSISEMMKPEELIGVLNTYLSIVVESVLKHDGMINKFGGDSVVAVWNAPTTYEGHELLAIKAALDVQDGISKLHKNDPALPKVKFGIGINTGKAIAGNIGSEDRMEYSVIGDAINIASRITAATPGGKVWIGAHTFELVKDYIMATPLNALMVKGKQEPVIAYEVVGICPGAYGFPKQGKSNKS